METKRICRNGALLLALALTALAVKPLIPAPLMASFALVSCGGNTSAAGNAVKLDVPGTFRPFDAVNLTLAESTECVLSVYDRWGRLVQDLTTLSPEETGNHAIFWNGRTQDGTAARPGTYRVTARTDAVTIERPLLLVSN